MTNGLNRYTEVIVENLVIITEAKKQKNLLNSRLIRICIPTKTIGIKYIQSPLND